LFGQNFSWFLYGAKKSKNKKEEGKTIEMIPQGNNQGKEKKRKN